MEIRQTAQAAWKENSCYLKKSCTSIAGGMIVSRFFGILSPKDGIIARVTELIVGIFMKKTFLKNQDSFSTSEGFLKEVTAVFLTYTTLQGVFFLLGRPLTIWTLFKFTVTANFMEMALRKCIDVVI